MKRIIKALKANKDVDQWRIVHRKATGYQLYVIGSMVDNIRKIVTDKYFVTIYCRNDGGMGYTHFSVFAHDMPDMEKRLEPAVFTAKRTQNPFFELPMPGYSPAVETFDPTLTGNIEDILFVQLADRLIDAVEHEPYVRLSSSEYFLDVQDIHLCNSRGVNLNWNQTEIFFDGVLLSGNTGEEVEIHFEPRARRLQDLPIREIIREQAEFARDARHAVLPPSGKIPVVLSGEALTHIFAPLVHHTSGNTQYNRTSRFKPGQPIYQKDEPEGDLLTMISNGFIPFGLRTAPVDGDGVAAGRYELIREGIFRKPWCTQQYADYLGVDATGEIANLEIPIGSHSRKSLLEDDGPVVQVEAFSALMPDVVSGSFAAEIKVGYLYENGEKTPIRGGAVSGNLIDGFNRAHFSTEARQGQYGLSLTRFGTYRGPQSIRFEGFQVTGE
ncbi:MAG TPA: metallopeptidase TldD-related protein [bacterium]|nr:metallopeptidase TldD-related protein [bacterium]